MPKLFISHSSKDNAFAKQLADALRSRGADVWIDLSDIPAGMKWSTAIQRGLDGCEVLILVVTPDSMASNNVEDEWQYYLDNGKVVIPVNWIPAKRHFQVSRLQYVEFHGQDFEAAVSRLVAELARRGFALPQWQTPPPTPAQPQTPPPSPPRIQGGETTVAPLSETRQFPIILKPNWVGKIIPDPFAWCIVPAGKVTLEKGGYLKKATTFDVPEFHIARYPIANAQFEVFVKAKDGWANAAWWDYSDAARAWRKKKSKSPDVWFGDCADCPRETVAWYAAVAFTCWLSAKTGENISLPTEQQWQRAAQGDDGRAYPWGNEWDSGNCNSEESGIHKATPVTRYPQGASPYGVLDMSGNVWEWCMTDYEGGSQDIRSGEMHRVVRGGAWSYDQNNARIAFRHHFSPIYKFYHLGFRLVCSSPIG